MTTIIEQFILEKVSKIIQVHEPNVCPVLETPISELAIDSLRLLELVYELEEELDIVLDDYALVAMETLSDLTEVVQETLKSAA